MLLTSAFREDPQILAYTNGDERKIRLIAKLAFETA